MADFKRCIIVLYSQPRIRFWLGPLSCSAGTKALYMPGTRKICRLFDREIASKNSAGSLFGKGLQMNKKIVCNCDSLLLQFSQHPKPMAEIWGGGYRNLFFIWPRNKKRVTHLRFFDE